MSALDSVSRQASRLAASISRPVHVFVRDVGHGLLEVCHNSLALIGLAVVALGLFFATHAELRRNVEVHAFGWLQSRLVVPEPAEAANEAMVKTVGDADAVARATALDPRDLDRQQAAVANWLSRRYRVAPEPVSRLVQEAWSVGQQVRVEPTLLLAIMAIESSFNPFAQSSVGAQGLMQVMTRIHDDKYEAFGGNHAAFDPVANLRVGALVLKECIAKAGGVEAGLRFYVGAANLQEDGGYAAKVLAEQNRLQMVAAGRSVAIHTPTAPPQQAATPAASATTAAPAEMAAATEPSPQQVALK